MNKQKQYHESLLFGLCLLALFMLSSCLRGQPSEEPPMHVFLSMDDQPKYEVYEENDFFNDGSSNRNLVSGTVAQDKNRKWKSIRDENPLEVTRASMLQGQKNYQIYCTPCHGALGDGKGIVAQRGAKLGYVTPTSFHSETIRKQNDGYIFDVITNGVRNMGPYGSRIAAKDRWAIVQYVRALQKSQNARRSDVPLNVLSSMGETK